ncbi:MAG: hypothetical protein ABJH98_11700 [Reichenbachiella sp.]|uniref:hypothetical protein n=1 Tax=Reichenbachiella sp. TaxID=2184521 RepID=UPI0032983031
MYLRLALTLVLLVGNINLFGFGQDSLAHSTKQAQPERYKALGGNIFLGYGHLKGNISNYISNPIFLGINVDILRGKMVFQIDDYIGFGKTIQTLSFPDDLEWSENMPALHFMLGGNFGYTILNTEAIKIVPLSGIGINLLTSSFLTSSDNSKNEPILPYYKLGCYIDIKSLRLFKDHRSFNYDEDYTCIRLSFGINSPIGTPKYENYYDGNMVYFTIGMGGLGRQ